MRSLVGAVQWKLLHNLAVEREAIWSVVFSPDCKVLAVSGASGTISLWSLASGKQLKQLATMSRSSAHLAFSPDGHILAAGCSDSKVHLWDWKSGKELCVLTGYLKGYNGSLSDPAPQVKFSLDGRTLVGWGEETFVRQWEVASGQEIWPLAWITPLIGDVAFDRTSCVLAIGGKVDGTGAVQFHDVAGRNRVRKLLSAQEAEALWGNLSHERASSAREALWALTYGGDETIRLLKDRLHPMLSVPGHQMQQLIADLDSPEFGTRERATEALRDIGELALPALRTAASVDAPLERRVRCERLLRMLEYSPSPDKLRTLRAIEVLERLNTAESKQILQRLADGAQPARMTEEAKAALARLGK
jgi:WD40 repeat protein